MHVLYIEDDKTLIEIVKYKYPEIDFVGVETLAAAKQSLAENNRFDVLLVDLNLPDSKGLETAAELKRQGIPIVIMTGLPSRDFVNKASIIGITDYILKSDFLNVDIQDKLQKAHDKYHQRAKRAMFDFDNIELCKPYMSCPPFDKLTRIHILA